MRGAFARAAATLRCACAIVAVGLAARAAVGAAPPDPPLKDNLYGVKFVDAQHGWVVGAFGSIAHTTDGGKTWQPQASKTTQQLYGVDFVDPQQGWIVGRQGLILHTTDGGGTWQPQTSGTDQHLFSVDFVDDQYGVAVGDFGTIVVSSDGGQHWAKRSLTEDVILYDVAMTDRARGWVAGELGTILVTTDGGQTWTKQQTGIEKTLFGIHFADAQNGWAVGIDALILHTTDGGQTWQVQNGSTEMRALEQVGFGQAYDNPSLYAIAVAGPVGIAAGEIGAIYVSADGGQTWARQENRDEKASRPKWFRAASMVRGGYGAIVGAEGARVLIADGQIEERNGGYVLPKRYIERYLHFLLRRRVPVALVVSAVTLFFIWFSFEHLTIFTNFFDLYPPNHPYIQVYQKYRKMFGTSNVLLMTVEAKNGTIFDDPDIIKTVDRITIDLLREVPGVNGEQVMSITHPKIKTTLTTGAGLKTVPLTYPRLPEDKEDLEFFRRKVDTTQGVRGFFVSEDGKATQIIAGFWEEYFDLATMWKKIQEIVAREEAGGKVKIYVCGPPILFAYFNEAMGTMGYFLGGTGLMMIALLWFYFRTIQGVVIPTFSALLSAVWGLGFAGLFGYSLDPLVIVVFVLITARTLSHSVQSMERYHEEYFRLGEKNPAIIKSYISLYAPAMVSIVADGLAILTIAVATIPLMQKLAFVAGFWIISIFISVVTLHPIILSFVRPPKAHRQDNLFDKAATVLGRRLVTLAIGNMRYAVVAFFIVTMAFGVYFSRQLKTGDTSPGMALLYPNHPYNVANATANHYFVGNSPLVIIAEGKKPGAIKDANTLNQLDLFQRYMEQGEGAGGSVTATTMLKTIFRVFHEGDPKWEMLPTRDDYVGQLFFMLTAGTRRGELDRFFSPDYTNATITVFYKNYDHETIKGAIERAKEYIATHTAADSVRYRLAGGLFGILAAQIEEVDWSYEVNVPLIFLVVFLLSFLTYWSVLGALIVMLPSIVAQPLTEAAMYLMGIDFNINSLPVAAIGIGIGIDYGYYVLSRIVEEYEVTRDFDEANRRALTTTGEAVMFTGLTITTSMILWLFHPLKFEAQMAFLLMMLMVFHAIGALVFIPAMVSLLRPRFATAKADQQPVRLAVEA